MSDTERVQREAEEERRKREELRASYSPELRELYDKCLALREAWQELATVEVALKTAIGGLAGVRSHVEGGSETAIEIDSLVPKLKQMYGETYSDGRAQLRESQKAYEIFAAAQREERVSRLKPENQEKGRALLEEMDQKLAEVKQPIDAGRVGGAAGAVFGLEMRREHAQKAGNSVELAHIEKSLESARKEMHDAEALMRGYQETRASIQSSYEELLKQLE